MTPLYALYCQPFNGRWLVPSTGRRTLIIRCRRGRCPTMGCPAPPTTMNLAPPATIWTTKGATVPTTNSSLCRGTHTARCRYRYYPPLQTFRTRFRIVTSRPRRCTTDNGRGRNRVLRWSKKRTMCHRTNHLARRCESVVTTFVYLVRRARLSSIVWCYCHATSPPTAWYPTIGPFATGGARNKMRPVTASASSRRKVPI